MTMTKELLKERLNQTGSLALKEFAEDMPGGTHGRPKSEVIAYLMSGRDAEAIARFEESWRIMEASRARRS